MRNRQKTTIPLLKNNEFDYADVITWIDESWSLYAWLVFIPLVIFIVTAVSNGANLTDGIDGLVAGTANLIVLVLGVFAWVSGNIIFSDYLNVMYIPDVSELVIFIAAFAGGSCWILWYNNYPAQVFMGDTELDHWRNYCCPCPFGSQRITYPSVVWCVLYRELISHTASWILQIH